MHRVFASAPFIVLQPKTGTKENFPRTQLTYVPTYLLRYFIHVRGVNKGEAGGAIAPPYFVRIEGAAGQRRRAALLLAPHF